jgi:2-polyprenyl-3-methyl-5-hydroxy-6-metoxy-1,4-benzoquinol methylase
MSITPKEKYTQEQFLEALKDPEVKHLKDREVFKGFYDRLGEMEVQKTQDYKEWRMDFIKMGTPNIFDQVIELGCHAGFNLIHYARLGYNVTGVDVSTSLIELAKEKISKESPDVRNRITLVNAFIEDLPDSFDVKYKFAIITETLEHVQDPLRILQRTTRLLTRKGIAFISAPSTRTGLYNHVRGINPAEMKRLLIKAGLTVNQIWVKRKLTFAMAVKR